MTLRVLESAKFCPLIIPLFQVNSVAGTFTSELKMARNIIEDLVFSFGLILVLHSVSVAAFGAGNIGTQDPMPSNETNLLTSVIASISAIEGQNWRHGDIEDTLLTIAMARVAGGKKFGKLDVKRYDRLGLSYGPDRTAGWNAFNPLTLISGFTSETGCVTIARLLMLVPSST